MYQRKAALERAAIDLFGILWRPDHDRTDHGLVSCLDAFSQREPASTPHQARGRFLLENALEPAKPALPARSCQKVRKSPAF